MKEQYWISEEKNLPTDKREVLNDFLKSLKLSNKSSGTIDVYRRCLQRYLTYFDKPLHEIEASDVKSWLEVFREGKKPRTINSSLAMLSSFFTYCRHEGIVDGVLVKGR